MCWLSSTCKEKSNYEVLPTTMMANFRLCYSIIEMVTIRWGCGWRRLALRPMAIIVACCAIKIKELLDNDQNFSMQVGTCAALWKKKQQKLKKIATRAVYFLSKLLFKPHPSPRSPFRLYVPPCHQRLKSKFIKASLQLYWWYFTV